METVNKYDELMKRQAAEIKALPGVFAVTDVEMWRGMEQLGMNPEAETDISNIYRAKGTAACCRLADAPKLHAILDRHGRELAASIEADTTGEGFIYDMFLSGFRARGYYYARKVEPTLDDLGLTWGDVGEKTPMENGLWLAQAEALRMAG